MIRVIYLHKALGTRKSENITSFAPNDEMLWIAINIDTLYFTHLTLLHFTLFEL